MKILIVGMGLIGGSVCKALKNKTQYEVYGCDVDESVLQQALQDHAIDGTGKMEDGIYDVCIVCLHHAENKGNHHQFSQQSHWGHL